MKTKKCTIPVYYHAVLMSCSDLTCGAVCIYPNRVSDCIASLKAAGSSHIPVASGTVSLCMHAFHYSNFYKWLKIANMWPHVFSPCLVHSVFNSSMSIVEQLQMFLCTGLVCEEKITIKLNDVS